MNRDTKQNEAKLRRHLVLLEIMHGHAEHALRLHHHMAHQRVLVERENKQKNRGVNRARNRGANRARNRGIGQGTGVPNRNHEQPRPDSNQLEGLPRTVQGSRGTKPLPSAPTTLIYPP